MSNDSNFFPWVSFFLFLVKILSRLLLSMDMLILSKSSFALFQLA